jgi:adenine C2-methylase RlmN of 23S rRNA A2503 and tRNA A37
MGKLADLTCGEIVEQVYHAMIQCSREQQRNTTDDDLTIPKISNVVFMGMGEPLDNYNAVRDAIHSLSLPPFHLPPGRITVSTVGANIHNIRKLAQENLGLGGNAAVSLAVSLHAPNDLVRQQIVPTAKQHKIHDIMAAVYYYQDYHHNDGGSGNNNNKKGRRSTAMIKSGVPTKNTYDDNRTNNNEEKSGDDSKNTNENNSGGRRRHRQTSVMIEYIMIAGINDAIIHAHQLGKLLQGREFLINLIPYNPTSAGDRFDYTCPDDDTIKAFRDVLYEYPSSVPHKPLTCTIRWSSQRGQSLDAACGQLVVMPQKGRNDKTTTKTPVTRDMEDFGMDNASSLSKSSSSLKRPPQKGRQRGATPPLDGADPPPPDDARDDDDEESIWSWSFVGPILLSGMVAATIAAGLVVLLQQRSPRGGGGVGGMMRR